MANGVTITGGKQLQNLFKELPNRVANKVNRRATNLATTFILQAVKSECPVEHGTLKRSQVKKITSRGMSARGIVGADADAVGEDGEIPSKVDHLVVYGHATESGSVTTPNPYIQRGWDESIDAAQQKYAAEIAAGTEAEARKLGNG